ncbi:right-handed parallel beta-helix repeat-containing protein [Engelhardtia mirabilis]|uniref:Right handed beta helix domain-containing protein n=1 Tax=Engelhardtia mirabilis TaxID=2528011 RepID=A0A518BHB6_9BACT|nr:hypothetical protein Pla133_14250 [Planctomycetes bacterium Pla133]QDV00681.1 hypothetical protein Pla86_14240 [Planctomycetes bacterium Pla86]
MRSPSPVALSTLTYPTLALALALCLPASRAVAQTTWHVDGSVAGPGSGSAADPFASIQAAIDSNAAVDGDTILVGPGTYAELVDLGTKELVLRSSAGADQTIIDATIQWSLEQSAIKIRGGQGSACRVEGFTVVGGEGTQLVEPLFGTTVFAGGGLLVLGTSPTVVDCVFLSNTPGIGGGAYIRDGSPAFNGCRFDGNTTLREGGAIQATNSDLTLVDVELRQNKAEAGDGGGIHLVGGSLTMVGGLLEGNTAWNGGSGGNVALRQGAAAQLVNVSIRGGRTLDGNGAGLWVDASSAQLLQCELSTNFAGDVFSNREGGAVYVLSGELELRSCTLTGNSSARGGAVFVQDSTATAVDSSFVDNVVVSGGSFYYADGGGLGASQSAVVLDRCDFVGNRAWNQSPDSWVPIARGGALWTDSGSVVALDCAFRQNEAYYDAWADASGQKPVPGAQGGAVFGPATIVGSRFFANRAHSNPAVLTGRAEGGAVFGARLRGCLLVMNEVQGVGPVPDVGPAAQAASLRCCVLGVNLPSSLPPLGPLCVEQTCP